MALNLPGVPAYGEPVLLTRMVSHQELTADVSKGYISGEPRCVLVVYGMDAVASQGFPTQCFCSLQAPTPVEVYYDSQSIGEGLGVCFTWRGAVPLEEGQSLLLHCKSGLGVSWSLTVWGAYYDLHMSG
jgi:hypothetical protein